MFDIIQLKDNLAVIVDYNSVPLRWGDDDIPEIDFGLMEELASDA